MLRLKITRLDYFNLCKYQKIQRKTPGPPAQYRLLTKGLAIKNVKFIKPILREKADQLVKELIERIKVLNADDYYIMCVEELYVFGSYNSNSKDCGDIDLAFDLKRKRHLTREEIVKLGHERAPKSFKFVNRFGTSISGGRALYSRAVESL